LVRWYERHQRPLPWRDTRDPYAIWVSEIMLQQTQVATVIDYYGRWMQRFPTVRALATASEDDVLHAWQGLGYYSRARRLREGAKVVLERYRGNLPSDAEERVRIPGVGRYTAGAISSIAYGKRAPIVDGNVTRVLSRLHGLEGDPQKAALARELWKRAAELVVAGPPSSVNQGLMELGATVCTPRAPNCTHCPFAASCVAKREDAPERYPGVQKRPQVSAVSMAGVVIHRRGKVLLTKLAKNASRWASMWQFPCVESATHESSEAAASRAAREFSGLGLAGVRELCVVKHSVTRYRISLTVYEAEAPRGRARAAPGSVVSWYLPEELGELALPAAHARIAKRLV
jgi:A/G-specific adenine glycosylase